MLVTNQTTKEFLKMKNHIIKLIFGALLAIASPAFAQVNVQKASGTNLISGDLTFGSGKSLTMLSGSTFTAVNPIFTGIGSFASGTNTAPSITFTADTITGLYLDATNVLGVATNGAGTVLFSSSAGVGKIKAHGTRALALEAGTGNANITMTPSGTGVVSVAGTIKSGSGSGETLSSGSLDLGADIGINSGNGIVQGAARIVTFTSGNATFTGAVTAGTVGTSAHTLNGADRVLTLVSSLTTDNCLLRFKGATDNKYSVGFNGGKLIFYSDIGVAYLGQWDTTSLAITGGLSTTGAATFAGAVRMSNYGAGAATFDSSGNITSVSDARLKNITGTFTKGLAEIVKLTPKLYTWKPETGLVTDDINATLIAQDLIAAGIPEAVTTYRTVAVMENDVQSAEDIAAGKPVTQHAKLDALGKPVTQRVDSNYSVSDRTVIAALVNAVKELKAEIDALKAAK
jgi:hypothetical protein